MKGTTLIILALTFCSGALAQSENRYIRKGNSAYGEENFKDAEVNYLKAREKEKSSLKPVFNLGSTWYQQENYQQAAAAYDSLRTMHLDDEVKAKTYYNLGNSLLKIALDSAEIAGQILPPSIEAFKNSLKSDPDDMDAKYNLAYARKLLENSQQQQQDQQDDQQQEQDQDQEQQEQEQDQEQQDQQRQQPQEQKMDQISKEDAERILQALKNDEQKTLEKLKKVDVKVMTGKSEKDW